MVTQYGMSESLGPIVYGSGHSEIFLGRDFNNTRNYSEKIAAMIDDEVMNVIDGAYNKARSILEDNIKKLHFIAEFLIKNEAMDGEQFEMAMTTDATNEEIEAVSEKKARTSRDENDKKRNEDEQKRKELAEKLAKDIARPSAQNYNENRSNDPAESGENKDNK
ncbi:ATP-dependent zinc metalloprotease FtsH [bioreactor metagenome]|uniref:ATP-dependent zinc metalloprotease FtsH n=1 Tax=bioreactor metagenome TaxID=1076179 RepID=A0A645ESU8_9ZZZZ